MPALAHRPTRRLSPRKHRGYRRVVRRSSWGRSLYNYARDYDPSTGRFIESDPLGLYGSAHTYDLIRDYDPQTDQYVQANPLGASGAVNTYRYVRDNPLEYVDPTGKFEVLAFIVPVVAVGGGLACYIHGLHQCEKLYPNHRDPLSPDYVRFIKCSTGVASVIGRGMGLSSDPLGGGVGAAGEAAGEASSK